MQMLDPIKKMNLKNLRQRFFKEPELTIHPWPGGELSFRRQEGVVICDNLYLCGEETESDLEFHYEYRIPISDFIKGLKDLGGKGSCSISLGFPKVWYSSNLSLPKDTLNMELQNDGTAKIFYNIKTPWTVKHISECLGI